MILKDDNGKELPKKVQKQMNDYVERIKKIKWFQPDANLDKKKLEKQIKLTLEALGFKAGIEYRKLEKYSDWGASWSAAWDSSWSASWSAAWDSSWGASWSAAWDSSWGASWGVVRGVVGSAALTAGLTAVWDTVRGAQDLLTQNLEEYKKKYPNGNFINMIPLWEMGLYPVGVIDGKFVIYIPPCKQEFPEIK